MLRQFLVLFWATVLGAPPLPAQEREKGNGFEIPESSVEAASDVGGRAHTNHVILTKPGGGLGPTGGMTPAQIRSFYGMPSTGGQGVIAIVDAYHYPTALGDFNKFASQFKLPVEASTDATAAGNAVFQVVYTNGVRPRSNTGWNQEAALDIEWAHALAPGAKIVLVEALSASFSDLFAAVDWAVTKVPGVTQISMSWGGSEFPTESSYDSHFVSGPLFFAASGDTGGKTIYPSASPYVVAVGGTSVATLLSGQYQSETGWSGSGGGPSVYELQQEWQSTVGASLKPPNHTNRLVPDISADADPNTGVQVYGPVTSKRSGWLVFGGTSVSTPCMAAMVNVTGSKFVSTVDLLSNLYAGTAFKSYRDITSGTAGSFSCTPGWDFVTGVGTPQGGY